YDDINKSVLLIDSLFDKKSSNNESVKIVKRVLEIWQGLARDIILLKSGNEELVQHNVFSEELEMVKQKFSDNQILDIFKKIKNAEGYLERNVNSKLILEEILLTT
ncbi:hypothetical protein KAI92_01475, partial [Candidatus Parcubacteria bacterium]|nr:hypothetical protein [Candidatus Parcubacteria bacterium]